MGREEGRREMKLAVLPVPPATHPTTHAPTPACVGVHMCMPMHTRSPVRLRHALHQLRFNRHVLNAPAARRLQRGRLGWVAWVHQCARVRMYARPA